jgi:deoxyhypusine synthase
MAKSKWLSGKRIDPTPVASGVTAADLIDQAYLAYNAGRLQKAARLLVDKMLEPDCFVGLSLTGALTPAGLGRSVLIPMIRAGFVDWIVSTGANLYHDAHFGLGLALHQ